MTQTSYEPLRSQDEESFESFDPKKENPREPLPVSGSTWSWCLIVSLAVVACNSFIIGWNAANWRFYQHFDASQCGRTPAEARSRGCKFELLNWAWLPPACYDQELNGEWLSVERKTPLTHDQAGHNSISLETAQLGNTRTAWVQMSRHRAHCVFMEMKYQRAINAGRPLDNYTWNSMHSEHCGKMLLGGASAAHLAHNQLHMKYPTCDYRWMEESKAFRPVTE